MTENKRYYLECDEYNAWSIWEADKDRIVFDLTRVDAQIICGILNAQHEEITQLKFQLQNTCDQRDEFYRGARENANRVGKLKKENEQLKEKNLNLRKCINEIYRICNSYQQNLKELEEIHDLLNEREDNND